MKTVRSMRSSGRGRRGIRVRLHIPAALRRALSASARPDARLPRPSAMCTRPESAHAQVAPTRRGACADRAHVGVVKRIGHRRLGNARPQRRDDHEDDERTADSMSGVTPGATAIRQRRGCCPSLSPSRKFQGEHPPRARAEVSSAPVFRHGPPDSRRRREARRRHKILSAAGRRASTEVRSCV